MALLYIVCKDQSCKFQIIDRRCCNRKVLGLQHVRWDLELERTIRMPFYSALLPSSDYQKSRK